jgi:hypothetical protein
LSCAQRTERRTLKGYTWTVSASSAHLLRVADDGSRWRGPVPTMASMPLLRMGPPPRSFAADAQHCIMGSGLRHPPYTRLRHDPLRALRLRHPDTPKRAVVLGPVKAKPSVAAKWRPAIDRSCARRPLRIRWVGARKRDPPSRTRKLRMKRRRRSSKKRDRKMDRTLGVTPLTEIDPYKVRSVTHVSGLDTM